MKKLFFMLSLLFVFAVPVNAGIKDVPNKIIDTSWIKQTTLKYSFIGSFCLSQSLTGLTEGYHWGNLKGEKGYIVNNTNYHFYDGMRRRSWIITGWTGYANYQSADLKWHGKLRRLAGTVLVSRNCFEWAYKTQRYGNPFDYRPEHNKCAIVYLKFSKGKLIDAYISTGNLSTPIADIAFLVAGFLLLK